MEDKTLLANLLIMLQNFENFWNMYSVSEGVLYREQTKESAKNFLELFDKVAEAHPDIRNTKAVSINSEDSTEHIDSIVGLLKVWVNNETLFPFSSQEIGIGDNEKSRYLLQPFFMCLSVFIIKRIDLEYRPVLCKSSGEGAFHHNNVKWKGRFPWLVSDRVDKGFLCSLSKSETVVVVGDIRKSQDLITYAVNPDTYRSNMVTYIEKIRKTILDNKGIFDRFTGDGFICYFNAYLSNMLHEDLYKSVINACVNIQQESKPFFEKWQQELQKIPYDTIGLSIGVDVGKMDFSNDGMMLAIGTPAVWATRMCAVGNAGDIVLNNIAHAKICDGESKHGFDELRGTTKGGEQFKAFRLVYGSTQDLTIIE